MSCLRWTARVTLRLPPTIKNINKSILSNFRIKLFLAAFANNASRLKITLSLLFSFIYGLAFIIPNRSHNTMHCFPKSKYFSISKRKRGISMGGKMGNRIMKWEGNKKRVGEREADRRRWGPAWDVAPSGCRYPVGPTLFICVGGICGVDFGFRFPLLIQPLISFFLSFHTNIAFFLLI